VAFLTALTGVLISAGTYYDDTEGAHENA